MFSQFSRMSLILSLAAAVAGCATMSADECRHANWKDVGLRDGLEGQPLSLLKSRTQDCAEAKVAVDAQAYLGGRELGLRTFCRLENAVPLGLNGGSYEGVCPPSIDAEFRWRFQIGRAVHDLRGEANRLDERIAAAERRLHASNRDEEKRLRETEKEEDRRRIRREFDEQRHRIRDELRDMDRQLRRVRDQLRDAEQVMSGVR